MTFPGVGGDDELIGCGGEALHQSADERPAGERHRGLAAAHAARLAACLYDDRHLWTRVALLHEIGQAGNVVGVDVRDAEDVGRPLGFGDVRHDGHRVGRGHLVLEVVGEVGLLGLLELEGAIAARLLREIGSERLACFGRLHECFGHLGVGGVA